tara:strand:+ start:105 stop:506 length:402 start_codon:yes stop_codon:yes gene_type:complete
MKNFEQGVDITDIRRIEIIYKKHKNKFLSKILSQTEIKYFKSLESNYSFFLKKLAGRFAAKEAASKALGVGFRDGVRFKDFEISNDDLNKPVIKVRGCAHDIIKKKQSSSFISKVTISNEKHYVIALVTFIFF